MCRNGQPQISSIVLQFSSPLSILKNNYVLNGSTFYHYWLGNESCYALPVRLPFTVMSSRFSELLQKFQTFWGFVPQILGWNIVAKKNFSVKPKKYFSVKRPSQLTLLVLNFLFSQKSQIQKRKNYNNIKLFSVAFSRGSFLGGNFSGST